MIFVIYIWILDHLVGGGNPVWASVNYVGHCWGLKWSFLTIFFCKMYFLYVSRSRKKNLVHFLLVLPPQMAFFSRGGTWPARLPELRALPSILAKCSVKKLHSSLVEVSGWPLCWNWGQCPHFWQTAEHGSFQLMAIISNWYSDTMNSSWMVVQWIPDVSTFHLNGVVNITDWTNMP